VPEGTSAEELDGLHFLRGAEVDVLPDGSLDLADETLEELEIVIVSVHSKSRKFLMRNTMRSSTL